MGDPETGDPEARELGDPETGNPEASELGDPDTGDPEAVDAKAGSPEAEQPVRLSFRVINC